MGKRKLNWVKVSKKYRKKKISTSEVFENNFIRDKFKENTCTRKKYVKAIKIKSKNKDLKN